MMFLVPDKQSASRRRFDAAHELGHLILHSQAAHGDDVLEAEANAFAGALLLPAEPFLSEFPRRLDWQALLVLKQRWGASLALLVRRAFDLQAISEATYRRAFQQLNQLDWRRIEPQEPSMERPSLIEKALKVLDDAGLSRSQVAAELDLHPAYLDKLTARAVSAAA
jgi:Zn-dependent peptidase ImmA (M78 family)